MVGRIAEMGKVGRSIGIFYNRCTLFQAVRANEEAVSQFARALVVSAVEERAVLIVIMSPKQFVLAAVVIVLAFDE